MSAFKTVAVLVSAKVKVKKWSDPVAVLVPGRGGTGFPVLLHPHIIIIIIIIIIIKRIYTRRLKAEVTRRRQKSLCWSFVRGHSWFFAKITKYMISLRFQILEKWENLWLPLNVQKPKVLKLQEASPLIPWPGALPLDSAGGSAPRSPL